LIAIIVTITILAGCANHEDNRESNKSKKEELNQHSSKKETKTRLLIPGKIQRINSLEHGVFIKFPF